MIINVVKHSSNTYYFGTDPFLYVCSSCIFFAANACWAIADGALGGWYFLTVLAL